MYEVAVLALPSVIGFELGLPHKFLGSAVGADGRPLYRVRTASLDGGPVRTSAEYTVLPDHDAAILREADTVVIPGVSDHPAVRRGELADELAAALAGLDARLVSICTGAFVLAAAGRLDGRRATTHWMYAEHFRRLFPRVELDPDVLYVDEGDVLTSAGNAAGIDLLLHLVRRDHGAAVAARVARRSVVAPWREGGQSQFAEPLPEPRGSSTAATQAWALEHLTEPLTVADLAAHARTSVRTFTRRFRRETGQSPAQWLIGRRVERARQLLEETDLPVERVAAEAGFGTTASLRQHLHAAIGVAPLAYRRTYRGDRAG
ncbi:transcriptional regulator, AraC family with amidase-like domain [Pseudonocardia thermophila]|uniref:Transcriptional regulator, AraC family with amidase-like domain n=1 Tax=Pseudonocardia thermophila TaxID=1848 RepID=A0A1M6YKK5_PSETH|nr:helix-turn-helix domain-containing protein [Pseudonocardia thermophila]SHL18612.1 transcriptional regulator, AraC family with amidase-like domain [Pseudonocardia thermophila]